MVELSRKDKVKKYEDRYEHHVTLIYPKINVKKMKESWKKTIDSSDEWLQLYIEKLDEAINIATSKYKTELELFGENLKAFESLSKEEQFEKLLKQFEVQKKQYEELKNNVEENCKKLEQELRDNYKKIKEEVIQKRKEAELSLNLWQNCR
jgi:DNA repair exonuclease SbcCD ATPase subunit